MENTQKFRNVLVITAGFLLFYWFLEFEIFLHLAILISVSGALFNKAAQAINWAWMKLALLLGWINTRVLLSLIYFLFLTPIALFSRLFTKDPLQLKKPKSTNYNTRNHLYQPTELENIW